MDLTSITHSVGVIRTEDPYTLILIAHYNEAADYVEQHSGVEMTSVRMVGGILVPHRWAKWVGKS